ncbi:MAG: hypothetical protein GWM98_25715, partial [Nitrospinaceae bacterium]|nr:hypothetical protein [Nitrospinaceae bacterium]NIR57251.1 hypothetical protein [Nitrospinaceae bacterium]NIS87699.1 hypothetical protein [Nitrospinaceae bacterium]NIT84565.1 hypothetical protein [Nitrospinaceae bacterium]NIU46751.1 hypothetical protein [Nitrospinaceae bacterium]
MAKFSFKKKIRILLLLALIPMAGVPIWINSGDPPVDSDQLIPPMRAEGKADQHLQKASEDFFFRDFTHAEE